MALITRLVGLNLLVLLLWAYAALAGSTSNYVDLPNLFFVCGVVIAGALICFSIGQLGDAFVTAMHPESARPVSRWQREIRIAVFSRLYQLAWGAGLLSALLALIAMLGDLSAPASIGKGMAVALTGPVYGALLAEFVFNPMQQLVMNLPPTTDDPNSGQADAPPSAVPTPSQTALFKGVAVIAVMIAAFMVPIVSFSEIKKEDTLAPETEATYLRYLFGDDAPQSQAVSPRLQATADQRAREVQVVYEVLYERMPGQGRDAIENAALQILAIPQHEGIDPAQSHLWRRHLADEYVNAYDARLLR